VAFDAFAAQVLDRFGDRLAADVGNAHLASRATEHFRLTETGTARTPGDESRPAGEIKCHRIHSFTIRLGRLLVDTECKFYL
jgi:hypothetical protein